MKKNLNLIYVSISLVLIIMILFLMFLFAYHSLKSNVKETKSKILYASVVEKGKNYIKVKDEKEKAFYYLKYYKDDIKEGEIIAINYEENIDDYKSIDVIVKNNEDIIITAAISSTTSISTKPSSTFTKNKTVTQDKELQYSDDYIISSFKASYEEINSNSDKSFKEKVKDKFIEIVDFIFYGTEINGRTFESLTNSAKAKVVYYALLIDGKINDKWPNYKDNLSDKYSDVKSKLIAKYLDLVDNICNNEDNKKYCEYVKSDFNLLKKSLNFTWDIIKAAFKYGYEKSSEALIRWYEVFSGKL